MTHPPIEQRIAASRPRAKRNGFTERRGHRPPFFARLDVSAGRATVWLPMELSDQELQEALVFLISLGIGPVDGPWSASVNPRARPGCAPSGSPVWWVHFAGLLTEVSGSAWLIPAMLLGLALMMGLAPREKGGKDDPGHHHHGRAAAVLRPRAPPAW